MFLCGHYEGVDERVLEMIATDYLSAGDYVLTGGELPAMMMIDCISRLVPGVLNNNVSAEFETFHDNLLEYPQYTRPEVFMGKKVPDILLSGHHANVEKWRREQSIIRTLKNRPELLEDAVLSKKEQKFLDELLRQQELENAQKVRVHHHGRIFFSACIRLPHDQTIPRCLRGSGLSSEYRESIRHFPLSEHVVIADTPGRGLIRSICPFIGRSVRFCPDNIPELLIL